jgi:hypothetical protein
MAEWKKVLVSGSAADVTSLKLASVVNASADTDKFLVLDSSGNVDFRTGTEVRSDIGAGAGSGDIARVNITAGSGLDGSQDTATGTHTQTLNLDIDGLTDIGADLAAADILAVDDGAGGTNRKASMTRMQKFMQDNLTFTTNTNTQLSTEAVEDIVDGLIVGGTNVTATYDDSAGTLTLASTDTNTQLSSGDVRGKLSGTGLIGYNSSTGVISTTANNYVLPEATSTAKGGIELFSNTDQTVGANAVSATASRTYGLQLNSAGQAVVNIPWTDTNTQTAVRGIRVTDGESTSNLASNETLTLTQGSNITLTESEGAVTISSTDTNTNTQLSTSQVRGKISASGNSQYNASTGVITSTDTNTQLTATQVRANLSGTGLIGYNSSTGVISTTANNYSLSAADVKSVLGGGMPSNALTIGDSTDTITIPGNLDVNGTTTTIDTTNLAVADKFIELNRGAASNGDGGFVVNGSDNRAFGWDDSADRWAFDFAGATANQTTIASDAFAVAVNIGGGTKLAEVDSNYAKSGNMFVNTDDEDIYIYIA